MEKYDVVVLGAGITGLIASYYATDEGFKTALIAPEIPSIVSTKKSVGIITRQLYTKKEINLAGETIKILFEVLPNIYRVMYSRDFITIEEEKTAFQDFRFYRKTIHDVDIYYYGETPDKFDVINLAVGEAILHTKQDVMLDTEATMNNIYSVVKNRTGLTEYRLKAEKLERTGSTEYTVYLENGEALGAKNVILAMGSWNKYFLENNRIYLPVATYACIAVRFEVDGEIPISGSDEVNYMYWMVEEDTVVAGEYYQSVPIIRPDRLDLVELENKDKTVRRALMDRFKSVKDLRLKEYIVGPCSVPLGKRPLFKEVMNNVFLIDGMAGYGFTLGPALAKEAISLVSQRMG